MRRASAAVEEMLRIAREGLPEDFDQKRNPAVGESPWQTIQLSKIRKTFGKRFQGATLENYEIYDDRQKSALDVCQGYVENIDAVMKKGWSLVLAGKSGTGKDHLVASVGRELISQGKTIHPGKFYEVVAECLAAQANGRKWTAPLRPFIQADVMILSEIGIQKNSDFERKIIYHLIDELYKEEKPFILTTNLSVSGLREAVDYDGQSRVWDRLNEVSRIISCDWASYRQRRK